MLRVLRRAAGARADRVAVRSATPDGGWVDTTWARFHDDVRAAARAAAGLTGSAPVVVVLDGTAASIATAAGVVAAGVDALLLEEHSSYLSDPGSPVHAAGPQAVVGPGYVAHEEFRVPDGADVPDGVPPGEVLQLTSGSTGESRIVRQPLSNVLTGGRLYRRLFAVTDRDTVLAAVPVAHSYGLAGLCAALSSGATLVTLPKFGLRALVAGLRDGATVLLGTPLLYQLLTPVLGRGGDGTGLRVALSAGGPMPTDTNAITAALGTPVRQIYGTTEAGLIACVPAAVATWPAGSVGLPAPGVTLRFTAATPEPEEASPGRAPGGSAAATPEPAEASPAGSDDAGPLSIRAPMMFAGYYGSSRAVVTPDGFYDTGDLARVDPAGHLFVLGRKEGVVNIGGRKVSPKRIERVLLSHAGVRDAFVFGVERNDHEQEMHAALVLAPGTRVEEVLGFCRSRSLQPYEVPHRVHPLDRLPRNGMGKVDRHRLESAIGR